MKGTSYQLESVKGLWVIFFPIKLLPIFVQRIWMSFGLSQWNGESDLLWNYCAEQYFRGGIQDGEQDGGTLSWPCGGSTQPGASLSTASWKSSLVQREMGLRCPACFTYLNCNTGLGYVPQSCVVLRKWDNLGIFFLSYATWLFCAPQMGKKSWRVSWDDYKFCNMPPRFKYWLRLGAGKGFGKEW